MTISFKPAKRENVPLLIGLDGASGSGKTYSAHELAQGMADEIGRANGRQGRVFGLDTERRRMLHYADDFAFQHGEIEPPFRPQAYVDGIDAAEKAGADVIIVDSFSHVWEGEGGVRDWAAALEAQGKKPPANWMEPKLAHKRMVNRMLASPAHIIVCMRSEEKMRIEAVPQFNDDGSPKMWNGKPSTKMVITPASEIPILQRWVPICEKRFPFEITTSMLLTPDNPGVPVPRKLQRQHRPFFPEGERITRDAGRQLAAWALGSSPAQAPASPDHDEILAGLEAVARPGNAAVLAERWQSIGKDARKALAPHLDRLKAQTELPAERQPESTTQGNDDGYNGI